MKWRTHIIAALVVFTTGVVFIAVRAPPLEIEAVGVFPSVVHPGGAVEIVRDVTWTRRDCVSVVAQTQVVDSIGFRHTREDHPIEIKERPTELVTEWQVPFAFPFGMSLYRSELSFECFPFYGRWPIMVPVVARKFEVIPLK